MNTGEKEYIIIDNCVSIINDSSSLDSFEDEVFISNRNTQTFFCSEKDTSTEGNNPSEQRGGTLIAPSVKEDWQNEPERDNNHLGTARKTEHQVDNGGGGADGGGMVDVDKTLERFIERTRTTLRDSSVSRYKSIFREFARASDLTRYTRRQLAGPTGKRLILAFITDKPRGYWRFVLAALKTVWLYGLDMPWPVDMRRDIGRLPKTLRGQSPPDDLVKQWAEAMRNEKDPYLRLIWLLIVQHGWRPSHLAHIKWRNIRYDAQGRPIAIVANGSQEGFKTEAPIAVRLAPDVQEALIQWSQLEEVSRNIGPERLVVPIRFHGGRLDFTEVSTQTFWMRLKTHWNQVQKKWGLPALKRKDLRHWVATVCRKAGLSKQASAYMMGHDPTQGGAMRDWYDNPQLEEIFAEQAERLPKGPLGTLEPPIIELVADIPSEALEVLRNYLDGTLGTMEMASRLEALKQRTKALGP